MPTMIIIDNTKLQTVNLEDMDLLSHEQKVMLFNRMDKLFLDINKKKFNPHSFRHARATEMARHLTEHQMDKYFGWVVGSRMAAHYVHLSGKSLDDALKKLNGLPVNEEDIKTKLKPKICPRCNMSNEFEREFCKNEGCHSPLDLKAALDFEKELAEKKEQNEKNEQMILPHQPRVSENSNIRF